MRQKELRLALICYGGVSLAIYMHGITKEIWKLAQASRDFHDGAKVDTCSRGTYYDILQWMEQETGVKLRVLPDIIAGASAGGINGIFLSQAILSGRSLEPLTELWLETADVDKLLDPDARPLSRFSKFWAEPIAWMALGRKGGAVEQTVSKEAREEVKMKLSRFVRARWFAPPFGGKVFSGLIFDALNAVRATEAGPRLLPPGQPLDLFVTVTDFVGHPEKLQLHSPPEAMEMEHRITIGFSTRGKRDGAIADLAELTFAARATASFPGAFPPFTVKELDEVLADHEYVWSGRKAFLKHILPNQFRAGTADDTVLIDGSVLANAPFAQAIEALKNRPAKREVDRRFVYIDPRPDLDVAKSDKALQRLQAEDESLPGFFSTIFGAISNIPREQPIRDNLNTIAGRSNRIIQMRKITDNLRTEVERNVETLFGRTLFLDRPTAARVAGWRRKSREKAAKLAGFSYSAYGHLKLASVIEDIATTIRRTKADPNAHNHPALRDALWTEIRRRGLDSVGKKGGAGPSKLAADFFGAHDLGYRIRRLRFLARRLAEDLDSAKTEEYEAIEAMHDVIYDCLSLYIERETIEYLGDEFAGLAEHAETSPSATLDALAKARDLQAADDVVDGKLAQALAGLPKSEKRSMLLAFLGFPFYDIATLPLLQGEGLDEFDPIKVDRISPEDARTIRKGGVAATLKGIEFNNFGAFFSRSYRENDYLWGRLHGAERMIDIVFSTLPAAKRPDDATTLEFKKTIFRKIVDEEEERLTRIAPLIASLRTEIERATS
ncbi:patatin-like protein [Parasphingorhabdus halotolerans]|uniref:Patatin-like protein n=1 Tax=Parasphingorhabdus halotolerans TaxID=2725558 RepID=A0A6H2DMQ7_9SPHN|nr:patatin-like protein [Parasphingorhabdus halotolerans]QJB68946.1 patatin-like protein [Parasphingorhabdus halotolerans]